MADQATLMKALRNAHNAGDEAGATRIAAMMKTQTVPPPLGKFNPMAGIPDVAVGKAGQFERLPEWKKPLVAADDIATVIGDSATFGFLPKAAAYAESKIKGTDYNQELSKNRGQVSDAHARAGSASIPASVIGSLAPMAKLQKLGATAQNIPKLGKYLGLTADGAALGALDAYGHDNDVATGAAFGAAGGAAGQLIGNAASKFAGLFSKKTKVPTYDEIKALASQKYDAAKGENVIYKPEGAQQLLSTIEKEFANRTFRPVAQPGANVAISELRKDVGSGLPVTAEGLQSIRSVAGEQFAPGKNSSNALLNIVKTKIDDFQMNPNPDHVLVGDATKAATLRKEADKLYSQQKKIETVRNALSLAENRAARTGSGGNLENTVKQELSKILNNPKKSRGFTPDEKAMVEDVIFNQGGRDTLRVLGKLSPFKHGGVAAIGAAGMLAEPITATSIMAGGALSKMLGGAIQKSKAAKIEKLIAGGGNTAAVFPKNKTQKAIEANKALIARMLMMGGLSTQNSQP